MIWYLLSAAFAVFAFTFAWLRRQNGFIETLGWLAAGFSGLALLAGVLLSRIALDGLLVGKPDTWYAVGLYGLIRLYAWLIFLVPALTAAVMVNWQFTGPIVTPRVVTTSQPTRSCS